MRNLVSIKKTSTLMVGKFAGLSVIATLAMIFVTPLMANPAMCGLPNHNANYTKVISGFTFDPSTKTYTFTEAPANTPIMIGTWLAVTDQETGKQVPLALEQPFRLSANGKYKSNAPAIPAPSIPQNAELITGIPSPLVAPVCTKDGMCKTSLTKEPATFVKIISGFTFDPSTKTYTFTEAPGFPLSLGSFVEVKLHDGRTVPASIVKFRGEQLLTPDKKNPTNIMHLGGYLYINPVAGDSTDQAQRLDITITKTDMDAITHSINTTGTSGTGWH